jgi:hypothetical protein
VPISLAFGKPDGDRVVFGPLGDYDFYEIVELSAQSDGTVAVRANLPSEDLWELELTPMETSDIDRLVSDIYAAEVQFGPLLGYCEACGIPPST